MRQKKEQETGNDKVNRKQHEQGKAKKKKKQKIPIQDQNPEYQYPKALQ